MNLPLESLFGAVNFIVAISVAYKLHGSMKKNPKDLNIRYFFYTFLILSFVFLFSAISVLSVLNFRTDFLISSINIIGRGLILFAIMFFCYIPLNILENEKWKKFLPIAILIAGFVSGMVSMISLFNYPRTPIQRFGSLMLRVHRNDIHTRIGLILIGSLAIFSLLLSAFKYFQLIKKSKKNSYAFKRGFLLIFAALFFAIGISSNYFLALAYPAIGRLGGEIFYFFALIIFLISAVYKKPAQLKAEVQNKE